MKHFALGFLCAIYAIAQDDVIRVSTRIVEVSVIARDKKGSPIRDLTKGDFVLFDNGKPRSISAFSVDSSDAPVASREPLAPNVFSNQPPARRSNVTILLLDGMNTEPVDQARSLPQIVSFLETIPRGDHVAIYTFGLSGLRILQDFTTDSARLKKAISDYRLRESGLGAQTVGAEPAQPNSFEAFAQNSAVKFEMLQLRLRVQRTLDALRAIANHVAGVHGRKSLVWVSSAFPFTFGLEEATARGVLASDVERGNFNYEVTQAMLAFQRANLAIYPVDARGLRGNVLGSAAGGAPVSHSPPGSTPATTRSIA
jgi:VWFA-related protein